MIDTAIIITDPQIAIKANRNANEGFYFYAINSEIKDVKFKLIIFGCYIHSDVSKEWAKSLIDNCLEKDGKVLGHPYTTAKKTKKGKSSKGKK